MNKQWVLGFLLMCVFSAFVIADAADDVSYETPVVDDADIQEFPDDLNESTVYEEQPPTRIITGEAAKNSHTRLVLLGTTGGISWWPETERASSSSALVIGDSLYIIDLGQGSASRLTGKFNYGDFVDTPGGKIQNGSSTFLEHAQALFFTHLHQDHTADYPQFLVIGPGAGLGTKPDPMSRCRSYCR